MNIENLEKEEFLKNDINQIPPEDIFAFNELRSCADLYRMYKQNDLEIQPEFQRNFIWNNAEQTRFIDSLIKQLPIPSICFSYDAKKQKWLTIDGLQRISTIIKLLDGGDWKLAKLDDIDQSISGKTAHEIKNNPVLVTYYKRIENSTIPITVLRCDYEKSSHLSYLFTVFHRLNSTGVKLNNQEIRNCIFSGPFNELLHKLDNNKEWKKINGGKSSKSIKTLRLHTQEMILRFFSFNEKIDEYNGSLPTFLNSFMSHNRYIPIEKSNELQKMFEDTISCVNRGIKHSGLNGKKISITLLDAILFATVRNLQTIQNLTDEKIGQLIDKVDNSKEFNEESLAEGLSKKDKLITRMKSAETIFKNTN